MERGTKMRFLSRLDWGADPAFPRKGVFVRASQRNKVFFHHTVTIDNDDSPNVWETLAEVRAKMRRLQTIRPDLGNDVPYNFCLFPMADGTLTVCAGRGYTRSGAHTGGRDKDGVRYNVSALGLAWVGNYHAYLTQMGPWVGEANEFLADLDRTFPNLRDDSPPGEREIWHHRDTYNTACPGDAIVRVIHQFTLKGDDMATELREHENKTALKEEVQSWFYELISAGLRGDGDLPDQLMENIEALFKVVRAQRG